MDLLAARDQENQVHRLQAGAAGKAGLKALGAKTPANKAPKTPFKVPLNDENAFGLPGKSLLKTNGKGNAPMTVKKNGQLDTNSFVTPAGPRSRAPLGMKTTNAKAAAFQTPAAGSSVKTQKASPRLRRPKVRVHQPEEEEEHDDVPEIEYMPPKEVPLLDAMDDYVPSNLKYPMFEGKNVTRGMWEVYHNPIEDDGRTRGQREFEENLEHDKKKRDEEFDKIFNAQWEKDQEETSRYFGVEPLKKAAPEPSLKPGDPKKKVTRAAPSTIKARSAVAALSSTSKPDFAASSATSKSRTVTNLNPLKKTPKPSAPPTTTRHAAAAAASNSTIGYARGRAASTNVAPRKPLSNVTKPPPFSTTARRPASATGNAITRTRAPSTSTVVSTTSSTRGSAPKSRGAFSRTDSASTQATLVAAPEVDEPQPSRTAEDLEREMERLFLQDSDGEDTDVWASSFADQIGGADPFDDDLDGFQMQLPEGL